MIRTQSIPLQDVDCTIEGTEFDFGSAGVHAPEERIADAPEGVVMRGGGKFGLVVDFALQRRGANVK